MPLKYRRGGGGGGRLVTPQFQQGGPVSTTTHAAQLQSGLCLPGRCQSVNINICAQGFPLNVHCRQSMGIFT